MPYDNFTHVHDWVFDLDHTLYPPSNSLFRLLETRMEAYLMRELGQDAPTAKSTRAVYWRKYGTTLAGMMAEHGTDPVAFLDEVEQIDMSELAPDPQLKTAISALPGRKIVFTNGSNDYAIRVLAALNLDGEFDAVYGIDDAGFVSKPHASAFKKVFESCSLAHENAAMFEDDPRNLEVPHRLGLRTVLVGSTDKHNHINHNTNTLGLFLNSIT